jgi:cation transport regulator ChaC
MSSIAVFGYGSLVDGASAATTLGRVVEEIWPATLPGWRRRFSQARENRRCEKTFARVEDGSVPQWILGLNLERSSVISEAPNGGLIAIEAAELAQLDRRELRYDRIDVTDQIISATGAPRFERVVTYVAKPAHLAPEPPPDAVILRSYAAAAETGFEALGEGQVDEYRRNTLPYPAPLIDGVLIGDRIPEGNPRHW